MFICFGVNGGGRAIQQCEQLNRRAVTRNVVSSRSRINILRNVHAAINFLAYLYHKFQCIVAFQSFNKNQKQATSCSVYLLKVFHYWGFSIKPWLTSFTVNLFETVGEKLPTYRVWQTLLKQSIAFKMIISHHSALKTYWFRSSLVSVHSSQLHVIYCSQVSPFAIYVLLLFWSVI